MRISDISFKEFRRFHQLQIADIPTTAKLVILSGPNGNGKSSVFDGMMKFWERHGALGMNQDDTYYARMGSINPSAAMTQTHVNFHGNNALTQQIFRKSFYFRSAYRNEAEMRNEPIQRVGPAVEERRFYRLIDNDAAVGANYKRLVTQGLADIYEVTDPLTTVGAFREDSIGKLQRAINAVFPHLTLNGLGNPMEVGEFRFTKGSQVGYSYKNLSGGEKAVFDILLDLAVKTREFDDTIFCIDEPEAHLNARVHGALLDGMLSFISETSQMWIATHSIGMMRRARDIERALPGSVAVIDFEADFDVEQVLRPVRMDRAFWQKSLSVAVDDLASLVAPSQIIACESSLPNGLPGEGHDAAIYNKIFEYEFPESRFISLGSFTDLTGNRFSVLQAVTNLIQGTGLLRLRDRDGMTEQEIVAAQSDGIRVLSRRHLEAYIFDEEVLDLLCEAIGKPEKKSELRLARTADLVEAQKQGHSSDNVKKAAGRIKVSCQRILDLQNSGSTSAAFMRDTLAPLIKPGTAVYSQLKYDIFSI